MFIVLVTYTKEIELIDQHLVAHRAFLDACYQKNYLIASGPQNPRTGGVLISQLTSQETLEQALQNDPFHIEKLASYQIIEFSPVKYHPNFSTFI